MTNKILFSIKSKMFTVYGFHMDFKFWSKKVLPRDFQMRLTHPWLWEGCDWCGMNPKSLKMDFRDLYRSGHVWLSVVLVYPNLSAFWTHPSGQRRKLIQMYQVKQNLPMMQLLNRIVQKQSLKRQWPQIQRQLMGLQVTNSGPKVTWS